MGLAERLLVLFNLHRALKSGTGTSVIVTEGFFDVMQISQAGFPHVVGFMGATLDAVQAVLLVEHCDTITLLFDEDNAGRVGRDEAMERLSRKVYVEDTRSRRGTGQGHPVWHRRALGVTIGRSGYQGKWRRHHDTSAHGHTHCPSGLAA